MNERFEKGYDDLGQDDDEVLFSTNSSTEEKLRKMKWLERALRKGKISQKYYDSKMKAIDEAIAEAEFAEMQKGLKEIPGKENPNPTMTMKNGHIVIKLKCPCCGTEGENTCGNITFSILGKDRKGFLYFECPQCKEHLQYDPMSGRIRIQKGLLGFLFGKFS